MLPTHTLTVVCLTFVITWTALSASVLASRAMFDRRRRREARDAIQLRQGSLAGPRLRPVALGQPGPAASAAASALVQADRRRLIHVGLVSRRRLDRLEALRILARAHAPEAVGLLGKAIREGNRSRTAAAVSILSEVDSPAADDLLLDTLVSGAHPRSRTATLLEPRVERLRGELVELAGSEDGAVRYWSLTLLQRAPPDPAVRAVAVAGGCDGEPMVRAAAAKLLAHSTGEAVLAALGPLLRDEQFYVRAHAARAAGVAGAVELARDVSVLLADSNWWVRAAAREGLLALGLAGVAAAVDMLNDSDRFARDGAREVIAAWDRLHGLTAWEVGGTCSNALEKDVLRRAPDLFNVPAAREAEIVR